MKDVTDRFTLDLRDRLFAGEFRCLSSFLQELLELSGAEGAGVFAVEGNDVISRRTVGRVFGEIDRALTRRIRGSERSRIVGGTGDDGKPFVVRRIWPARSWLTRPGEQLWLYAYNPRYVIPPRDCGDEQDSQQFGSLISTFIRWKNEQLDQRREALRDSPSGGNTILFDFERITIRPVLPSHFLKILHRLTPEDQKPEPWIEAIWKLRDICKRPQECRCGDRNSSICPQTDAMDEVLGILAKLELWRTEFWKDSKTKGVGPEVRTKWLAEGLQGLQEAADKLRYQQNWWDQSAPDPIDFQDAIIGQNGERALTRHFCAEGITRALAKNRDRWGDENVHSSELEFPAKLASLASTLLGDGRWTSEAIDNLLEVVALFGHSVLDVPERIDLVRHLRQTIRGETALHTLKTRYRDHFFHTLEVCFLGFTLLTSRPKSDQTTFAGHLVTCLHRSADPKPAPLTEDEATQRESDLLAQWWTASLIHDTAYGIDIFDGTLRLLDFFSSRKEVKEFVESARGTVAKLAEPLRKLAPELDTDRSLGKGDHGVLAAASLDEILGKIGPSTRKRFQPAVRAIAFHNTRHPKIDAAIDPIAALLILCDTVQEWGRSSLGFDRSPAVLLSRMMEASLTPPDEQFGPVKRFGLTVSVQEDKTEKRWITRWDESGKLTIRLDYGDQSLRECRAKFTWADFTYNLQRVDFRSWGLDIRVMVTVPMPESSEPSRPAKSQFEYFGDFIEEQEARFIERWYRLAGRGNRDFAVCHNMSENQGTENIEFNLCELSREYAAETPLMGGGVSDFGAAISKWSVYTRELADAPPVQSPPV